MNHYGGFGDRSEIDLKADFAQLKGVFTFEVLRVAYFQSAQSQFTGEWGYLRFHQAHICLRDFRAICFDGFNYECVERGENKVYSGNK